MTQSDATRRETERPRERIAAILRINAILDLDSVFSLDAGRVMTYDTLLRRAWNGRALRRRARPVSDPRGAGLAGLADCPRVVGSAVGKEVASPLHRLVASGQRARWLVHRTARGGICRVDTTTISARCYPHYRDYPVAEPTLNSGSWPAQAVVRRMLRPVST